MDFYEFKVYNKINALLSRFYNDNVTLDFH